MHNRDGTLTRKHRVDQLKGLIDLLTNFSASQDDFSTDEDQEYDLRLHHAIDKTGEQFRFVRAEVVVATCQTLQADRELDVARADDVLNLEVREFGIEAQLLDDTSVFPRGQLGIILGFGTGHDHLARSEDQRSGFRFADTHDHGSKTLRRK